MTQDFHDVVWSLIRDVCGSEFAQPQASFYGLGGDSFLALALISELEETLGISLSTALLLNAEYMSDFVDAIADALSHR